MNPLDRTPPSSSRARGAASLWLLLSCSVVAIAVALLPGSAVFARRGPTWLAVGAGLAVFPILPFLWHGLAEARASARAVAPFTGRTRLGLRTLAVALLVLAASLAALGPKRALEHVTQLVARLHVRPSPTKATLPPPAVPFGLEPLIPADASLAVGLAGPAVMQRLAAYGVDTRERLAALATCKIDFANARVLIAARGTGTRMIVVRAPGITDARNLYCLVGVLGPDRVQVGTEVSDGGRILHVKGWSAQPLTFRVLDDSTMIATDPSWQATAAKKLFADEPDASKGRLAVPLGRVRLVAPLWIAGVTETPEGTWDLAIDASQEGNRFKLKGNVTPPSGEEDRADVSASVPLTFAAALPEAAMALGIRGAITAIAAATAASSAP